MFGTTKRQTEDLRENRNPDPVRRTKNVVLRLSIDPAKAEKDLRPYEEDYDVVSVSPVNLMGQTAYMMAVLNRTTP